MINPKLRKSVARETREIFVRFEKRLIFSVLFRFSDDQQNDESVAANAQEDPKDEGDAKSDQFVVTQEYIQDSM